MERKDIHESIYTTIQYWELHKHDKVKDLRYIVCRKNLHFIDNR